MPKSQSSLMTVSHECPGLLPGQSVLWCGLPPFLIYICICTHIYACVHLYIYTQTYAIKHMYLLKQAHTLSPAIYPTFIQLNINQSITPVSKSVYNKICL